MEELSSTKNNDFISKSSITNTFGIAAPPRRSSTTSATSTGA